MQTRIKISDESGDKKYFSQLPHYILNHSTSTDQALYWQMKRYAGETGKCFATQETLMKKLGVGKQKFKKSLEYLLSKKWIRFIGMTGSKTRPIRTYAIVDIWKLNILNYEKIPSETEVSFQEIPSRMEGDTVQNGSKIPSRTAIEEEPIKEEPIKELPATAGAEWNFKKYLEEMENQPRRDLSIIALYWKFKKFSFTNKKQTEVQLRRSLRAAKDLDPFEDEKIWKTMDWLNKNADFKWVLESVSKYILEDLSKLKK